MDKLTLRKNVLELRKRDALKDKLIFDNLFELIKGFKKIAIYKAIREEPLLDPYWEMLDKEIYLPIFKEKGFSKFLGKEFLKLSNFNILEPFGDIIDLNIIDAIVIPCLAVDKLGGRLGYGSGFYDRVLKEYKGLKIGITYSEFAYDFVFKEDHDIVVDYLVTEKGIVEFGE